MRALWVLVVVSACVQAGDVPCGGGVVCPVDYTCKTYGCASPEQVQACMGHADGDECTTSGRPGHCSEAACLTSFCGNGILELGEVCDDSNTVSGDGCSGTCTSLEVCGNQIIELDEECDNPDETKCDPVMCKIVRCGNDIKEAGEVCDDGNVVGKDGCSFDCRSLETCGNNTTDFIVGEECDDNNLRNFDGCNAKCQVEHVVWKPLSPASATPPVENVAGAYDAGRKRFVLFGGAVAFQGVAETWELDGATWIKRTPTRSPSPRYSARMAYDSKRGRIVLFGGQGNQGYDTSTWEYDGIKWTENATALRPPGRTEHGLVYDPARERIVMFGGIDGSNVRKDTWEYDGTVWTETTATGGPVARQLAGMTYDPVRGKVLLYGGTDSSMSAAYNDTWQYNGTWSPLSVSSPGIGRFNVTLTFDPVRGETVMAGGQYQASDISETYTLGSSGWSALAGASPTHRGHVAAFDPVRGRVILWGGVFNGSGQFRLTELIGSTWTDVVLGNQATPYVYTPALAFDTGRGELLAFGGRDGGAPGSNALWAMDDVDWHQISTTGGPPPARYRSAIVYDAARKRLVLFGGQQDTNTVLGDTWELSGTTWIDRTQGSGGPSARAGHRLIYDSVRKKVVMFGGDAGGNTPVANNELWEWDGSGTWTKITLANAPAARTDFGMAFDSKQGRTVVWGGGTGPNDTYFYDGTSWSSDPSIDPPFRQGPAMTYDSARDRVVMHGGGIGSARDDVWEYDGTDWHEVLPSPSDPAFPASKEHAIAYDPFRARVIRVGAYASVPVYTFAAQATLAGSEICTSGKDYDGDAKVGCADDDCWGMCTPSCTPGSTNASCAMLQRCGDAVCDPVENCRTCPADCPLGGSACPVTCGDGFCDSAETAVSCPGDCG